MVEPDKSIAESRLPNNLTGF